MSAGTASAEGTFHRKGEPYQGETKEYPDGMTYNVVHGYHELALFHANPGKAELREFNEAPARMALWHNPPSLWIAMKFGSMNWADAPYNANLTPPEAGDHQTLESPESRYPVTMLYIDAKNGQIKAIRAATMSPELSREFLRIALEQKSKEFDREKYDRSIRKTMNQLTSTQVANRAHWSEVLGRN